MKTKSEEQQVKEKPVFQEVEVRRLRPEVKGDKVITKFEKLRVLRPRVKITQEQADILNRSNKEHPSNMFFSMYLLPGEEPQDLVHIVHKH